MNSLKSIIVNNKNSLSISELLSNLFNNQRMFSVNGFEICVCTRWTKFKTCGYKTSTGQQKWAEDVKMGEIVLNEIDKAFFSEIKDELNFWEACWVFSAYFFKSFSFIFWSFSMLSRYIFLSFSLLFLQSIAVAFAFTWAQLKHFLWFDFFKRKVGNINVRVERKQGVGRTGWWIFIESWHALDKDCAFSS